MLVASPANDWIRKDSQTNDAMQCHDDSQEKKRKDQTFRSKIPRQVAVGRLGRKQAKDNEREVDAR